MAVLPQCPEIQVSVVVGDMEGQPATEFDDSTDPTTETNEQTQHGIVSKYIESREGARFGFKFTADSGFLNKVLKKGEKLWFNVWLDGVSISGRLLGRSAYTANLFHNDIGQNRRKLYKFAALQTGELLAPFAHIADEDFADLSAIILLPTRQLTKGLQNRSKRIVRLPRRWAYSKYQCP
jgi:hypothetical protein